MASEIRAAIPFLSSMSRVAEAPSCQDDVVEEEPKNRGRAARQAPADQRRPNWTVH